MLLEMVPNWTQFSVDDNYDESCQEYSEPVDVKPIKRPSIIVAPKSESCEKSYDLLSYLSISGATQTTTSSGLYKESKRAIAEREKVSDMEKI